MSIVKNMNLVEAIPIRWGDKKIVENKRESNAEKVMFCFAAHMIWVAMIHITLFWWKIVI